MLSDDQRRKAVAMHLRLAIACLHGALDRIDDGADRMSLLKMVDDLEQMEERLDA